MNLTLNWRELAHYLEQIHTEAKNLFVDRILIPERPRFPEGFIKSEWAIRFSSRKKECALLFCVRSRMPYLALYAGKGPKASLSATHSSFDLALTKYLKGSKLLKAEALPNERIAVFTFSGVGAHSTCQLGLVLRLIPSAPEALLVQLEEQEGRIQEAKLKIISSSRKKPSEFFSIPDGTHAPLDVPIREKLVSNPFSFSEIVEEALEGEAFEIRNKQLEQKFKTEIKLLKNRIRQSEVSLEKALNEPDWQAKGDLLKASLFQASHHHLSGQDYLEEVYQKAKKKKRKIIEIQTRLSELNSKLTTFNGSAVEKIENDFQNKTPLVRNSSEIAWPGKTFTSADGLKIHVGRKREENLEITFKWARGNDLWLHVRGRPGAHAIISLDPGKTAPLETLLDAAQLVIYYSGGEKWGKTEVDYTFKKFVKRISGSQEVSYIQNKTLLVEPSSLRLKRLLNTL